MKNMWLGQLYTSYCANDNRSPRTYIGLNENIFKTKCKNHKTSFYSYMKIEMAPNLANMFGNIECLLQYQVEILKKNKPNHLTARLVNVFFAFGRSV